MSLEKKKRLFLGKDGSPGCCSEAKKKPKKQLMVANSVI